MIDLRVLPAVIAVGVAIFTLGYSFGVMQMMKVYSK